jgi:hypothetical protein
MSLIAFSFCIFLLAVWNARNDARDIADHVLIDHQQEWMYRALIAFGFAWVFGKGWGIVWMLIGGAFLFSAVFRLTLNRLRGKAWDYVSLSNTYDSVFIMAFGADAGRNAYVLEAAVCAACFALYPGV